MLSSARDVLALTLPGSYGGPALPLGRGSLLNLFADYVEMLLDAAGWSDPVAIVGSSYGGVTALELAARGRASRVIALAPPWISTTTVIPYGLYFGSSVLVLRVLRPLDLLGAWHWTPEPIRARLGALPFHWSARPMALSDDDLYTTLQSVRDFPFATAIRSRMPGPHRPDFERISCPVVLVWGTRDYLAPMWMARRWSAAIPAAELVTLAGFAHVPHLRDPSRIADLIGDHVGGGVTAA
jgi:pimeloyl-ACP methyl ester carboxylesterase